MSLFLNKKKTKKSMRGYSSSAGIGIMIGFFGMSFFLISKFLETANEISTRQTTIKLDEYYAYTHIIGVKISATDLYKRFGCYPTSADSLANKDKFILSDGNSCNEQITYDIKTPLIYHTHKNIKLSENEFHINAEEYKLTGSLFETNNNEIIYKAEITNKNISKKIYQICSKNLNETTDNKGINEPDFAGNAKLVNEKNPCGFDENKNPVIYIGKHNNDA